MSPTGARVELEVRPTKHGPEHVYECDNCDKGKILTCRHGTNCPCRGHLETCEDCGGTSEIVEEGCDCSLCEHIRAELENPPRLENPCEH